ncbi:MAG: M20/M25/M40 family metallo-hydrolase [Bacteroidetes bacterium]|nr:M20/M25/M40 family metallo-hydrolase [Bacteroidota bacterium]
MKSIFLTGLLSITAFFVYGQNIDDIINAKEVERIEKTLSSDEMRGRKAFTPDIDRAADFIAGEFKNSGIQTWKNSGSYLQEFFMVRAKMISAAAELDGTVLDPKNIAINSSHEELKVNASSGYEIATIKAGGNLLREASVFSRSGKNYIVLVDTAYAGSFSRLAAGRRSTFKTENSVIFLLTNRVPKTYSIEAKQEITEQRLANVVGVIPGKSRKDEYVIFAGHYDHLGVGKPVNGDSIYNGANDDAAGTTAVIMLAKYLSQLHNNERTLVFAAFTAEEVGGFGSQYFSKQFDPEKIVAMFNIEMIGTDSKWGKNSAYITGYERTDMGAILQKNLEGTQFTFYPDPYPKQNLFFRSDNATLAMLGVPAHTISTSKMGTPPDEPSEPNYHKVTDEISTLDMENMAMIIKAVALSSRGIIAGKETPSRLKE